MHATDEAGRRSRPQMPGYGVPTSAKGMLEWSHVETRMERAMHYWVAGCARYGFGYPAPCWALTPQVAFAWTNLTKDPTRWVLS